MNNIAKAAQIESDQNLYKKLPIKGFHSTFEKSSLIFTYLIAKLNLSYNSIITVFHRQHIPRTAISRELLKKPSNPITTFLPTVKMSLRHRNQSNRANIRSAAVSGSVDVCKLSITC